MTIADIAICGLDWGINFVDNGIIPLIIKNKPGNECFHADQDNMLREDNFFSTFMNSVFFSKSNYRITCDHRPGCNSCMIKMDYVFIKLEIWFHIVQSITK